MKNVELYKAMLRVLKNAEWSGTNNYEESYCPECLGKEAVDPNNPKDYFEEILKHPDDVIAYNNMPGIGHTFDCELEALLLILPTLIGETE